MHWKEKIRERRKLRKKLIANGFRPDCFTPTHKATTGIKDAIIIYIGEWNNYQDDAERSLGLDRIHRLKMLLPTHEIFMEEDCGLTRVSYNSNHDVHHYAYVVLER